MGRGTQVFLSKAALLHNLKRVRQLAPNSRVLAMVKAFAYGHGLDVADHLDAPVDGFGVASIEEAITLRQRGIQSSIVLMEGIFHNEELEFIQAHQFDFVIHCQQQIDWLLAYKPNQNQYQSKIWLKLDSGMGRLGFNLDGVLKAYQQLSRHKIYQESLGLMSHMACADQKDHSLNQSQIQLYQKAKQKIPGPYSCANSASLFHFPEVHDHWVRPGIMLYGISPIQNKTAQELNLKPVMQVQSRIMSIKTLSKGTTVGYGATWQCPEEMRVGIAAIGYGDGYPRLAPSGTPVLIHGQRCPIIGRISMDMMAIDLRSCPQAKIDSLIILWGNGLPVEEIANHVGTIAYELVCNMPLRVPYVWGEVEACKA